MFVQENRFHTLGVFYLFIFVISLDAINHKQRYFHAYDFLLTISYSFVMNLLRGYGLTRCGSFPSWFRLCSFTEPISENKIKLKVHFFRQDLLSRKYGVVWLFLPPGNVVAERSCFQSCLLVILSTVAGVPSYDH